MKFFIFLILIFLMGCQAKNGGSTGGGIISDHVPANNEFKLTTNLNETYTSSQIISFVANFPNDVTVTGSPQLNLVIGSTGRVASYVYGSGSRNLVFQYTVAPGETDSDGISVATSFNLNGGTLKYGSNLDCTNTIVIPSLSTVRVDTTSPVLTSVSGPTNGTYLLGQQLLFRAFFSESVVVSGSPSIAIDIGGVSKSVTYISGSGTSSLTFRYTVTSSDTDLNGIGSSSPIAMNGGTITDDAGNSSSLSFTLPDTTSVLVSGDTPYITNITPPANGSYTTGNQLTFNVIFNEIVNVTGSPRLQLDIGGATKYANYHSGSGTSTIRFRYTIGGGDVDNDGIGLVSPILLNGGSISDGSAVNALLAFNNQTLTNVTVVSPLPYISSVNIPGSIPAGGFDNGQNVDLTVIFSEPVTETGGTSRLKLDVAGVTRYATYVSGSGTSSLVYRYTVGATHEDLNGLSIVSPLELNGATLLTAGAATPTLTFTPPNSSTVIIDAVAPVLTANTKPSAGAYSTGQNLDFDVTWHEPVTVTGTPRLTIDIGGSTKYANYLSGSGTSTLRFRYTVVAMDTDADGISLNGTVSLNGGTIRDTKAHNAGLTLIDVNTSSITIDAASPAILSVTPPADGTYSLGQNLDFTANYDENVIITGTPRLSLDIGGNSRYATYVSGSGSSTILFRYTAIVSDTDLNGIGTTSPLDLNSGTIKDSAGNNAGLTFTLPNTSAVLVSGSGPTITSVTPPANGEYTTGQTLNFTVNFSETVMVTLIPRIEITLASGTVHADYVSGGGTSSLLFQYTVADGEFDTDGIQLVSPVDLDGGAIQNLSAQSANLIYSSPDTSGILIDGVDATILSVTPPTNGSYKLADQLNFTVNFSAAVTVSGTPQLSLTIGSTSLKANYISGSGTNALLFRYTVASNDEDTDGISLTSPVDLNGGSINDLTSDPATLTFSSPNTAGVLVDAVVPTVSSVSAPAGGTYNLGENLDFTVNFSENVTTVGSPRIALDVGGFTTYAVYQSGSGTSAHTFRYTVANGDLDSDGIGSSSPVQLNSGTLKDSAGNNSTLTFAVPNTSSVNVDGTAPSIVSVTPPANSTYKTGNNLNFSVLFSKSVIVTGTPRLSLTVGSTTHYANYVSGSGSNTLIFRYTVLAGEADEDGIGLAASVDLNSGTIKDSASVDSSLTFPAPDTSGVLVDGIDVSISSVTLPVDKTYISAEAVDFTVNFNYPATITGSPRIQLTVGATTRYATYQSGSGTTTVVFRWTVPSGDLDSDGIAVINNIGLNGGTIKDAFGDDATVTFSGGNYANKKVDAIAPTISNVSGPANGLYRSGEDLDFIVTFDSNVKVTGSPRISLTIGAATKYATYASGTGTTGLVFRYTVANGDLDMNGIASVSPITLNGGTLEDIPGNPATPLTFTPPNTSSVNVDGASPYIVNVTKPANGTFKTTNNLDFVVEFSETVNVVGTPRIALTVGASTLYANYSSGSGSAFLTFRYTVAAGHSDSDGVAMTTPIALNGGTIRNAATVNADLNFTPPITTGINVDGIDIVISSLTMPADKTYKIADQFDITVNYNYPATVTGTPRIQLTVGAATLYAGYVSGSGSTAHVFRYVVSSGELDADGITTVGPAIGLNGGTVKDAFGDNVNLNFSGSTYANKKVDGIRPTSGTSGVSANKTYIVGENIDFTVAYSEAVSITGTPRLVLTVGSSTLYANYTSGSGTASIVFRYTVLAGHLDTNGIAAANTIDFNGGNIADAAGNAQTVLTYTVPTLTGVLVDGTAPTITSITPPADQTFGNTAAINFIVNFSEAVTVTGFPTLTLNIGGAKTATYVSGTGSAALTFRYTTSAPDFDMDGIGTTSPVAGTIKDTAGNSAVLTFTGTNHTGVMVDAKPPQITLVTPPTDNSYQNAGTRPKLTFSVTFDESVTVTGTPRIHLTIGSTTQYALYVAGSSTATNKVFEYTVATTDADYDGIAIANSNNIDLNGGTMRDALLNNANLGMGSLSTSDIFVVAPGMAHWYDLSETSMLTINGSNKVTAMSDKVDTLTMTHNGAGTDYVATGFNGGAQAYTTCTSTNYFTNATARTWKAIVAVYRSPTTAATNDYIAMNSSNSTSRPIFQLYTSNQLRLGDAGNRFVGTSWTTSNTTSYNSFWNTNTVYAHGVSWTTSDSRGIRLCQFDGQLAEFFFFDAIPTAAQMLALESYISGKFGVGFP